MPDIARMLEAGQQVKDLFDGQLLSCKVLDSGEARVAATLCLTISEQFSGTLCLIENGFSSHAPTLVRSMLEGLANLLNLTADAKWLDQMRYENARSDVTLFNEYAADPAMKDDKEAVARLMEWKAKAEPIRDDLAKKGFKTISVIDTFRKANILQNYVAYRVFCSFAHNQLTTLIARHADRFELRYHHEAPVEMTASTLNVAVAIFCQAVATLPRFTDVTAPKMDEVTAAADQIWQKLTSGEQTVQSS